MKPNPAQHRYIVAATIIVGLLATEAWLIFRSREAAERALASWEDCKREHDRLACRSPALTVENEVALAEELVVAGRELESLRAALHISDSAPASVPPPPAKSIDAFFKLADGLDDLRRRAAQAQVALKADEYFGFATYAHEGPPAKHLAVVHRQQRHTQTLVGALLESRPLALLSVRRECLAATTPGDRAEDFFEPDRALALCSTGQVTGRAYQIEFTGTTTVLRIFLGSLATTHQPVVVRSVRVEPLTPDPAVEFVPPGMPMPLVRQSLSKFAITAEFIMPNDNSGSGTL